MCNDLVRNAAGVAPGSCGIKTHRTVVALWFWLWNRPGYRSAARLRFSDWWHWPWRTRASTARRHCGRLLQVASPLDDLQQPFARGVIFWWRPRRNQSQPQLQVFQRVMSSSPNFVLRWNGGIPPAAGVSLSRRFHRIPRFDPRRC